MILIFTIFSSFNFTFQSAVASPPATGDKAFANASVSYTHVNYWQQQAAVNSKVWSTNTTVPFGLDGQAVSNSAGTTTAHISITTTHTNDLLLVTSQVNPSSATCQSTGVSFSLREAYTGWDSSYPWYLNEWYGIAPSAATYVIYVNATTNLAGIVGIGISGVNIASPFDTHSGLPSVATGTGTTFSTAVSTSNATDMVIGFGANAQSYIASPGSGYVMVGGVSTGYEALEYQNETSVQTSLVSPDWVSEL